MHESADLPNVRFIASMEEIPAQVSEVPSRLRPFDAERAIAAVLARLGGGC